MGVHEFSRMHRNFAVDDMFFFLSREMNRENNKILFGRALYDVLEGMLLKFFREASPFTPVSSNLFHIFS